MCELVRRPLWEVVWKRLSQVCQHYLQAISARAPLGWPRDVTLDYWGSLERSLRDHPVGRRVRVAQ